MSNEKNMRIQHLLDSIRKAGECAALKEWEESLYHTDEARLLLQAIERDERITNYHKEKAA